MANGTLPAYLASAKPNPVENRAPWYKNTAQTYAGIFLWIAFYDELAGGADGPGALGMSGLGLCLLASGKGSTKCGAAALFQGCHG